MSELSTEDRLLITDLMARYCRAIDLNRWDEFETLFVEDCRLDFGAAMGAFDGLAGVRRFAETMKGLGLFMRHYTTNLIIEGNGDRARVEAYVLAITGPTDGRLTTTGRYEDELVKVGGAWRFRVRRALLDH